MHTLVRLIAGITIGLCATQAEAWDGVVTGKIYRLDTTNGQGYAFRVFISDQLACGTGSTNWAYMNVSDDNYQAKAALLTAAWLSSKTVTVYSNKDGSGYCAIGYVSVQN